MLQSEKFANNFGGILEFQVIYWVVEEAEGSE